MMAGPPVEPKACVFRVLSVAEFPAEKERQPIESGIQVEASLTINRGLNRSRIISHTITLCAKSFTFRKTEYEPKSSMKGASPLWLMFSNQNLPGLGGASRVYAGSEIKTLACEELDVFFAD
jgi:hypothetical protein